MVAGVIFTIAVTGVFASLAAIQKPTVDTDKNIGAALCGQQVLETLRAQVDDRNWASNDLSISGSPHSLPLAGYTFPACTGGTPTYAVSYTVTDAGNGARKVVATVTWP